MSGKRKVYLSHSNIADETLSRVAREELAKYDVDVFEYPKGTKFTNTPITDADTLFIVPPKQSNSIMGADFVFNIGRGQYDTIKTFREAHPKAGVFIALTSAVSNKLEWSMLNSLVLSDKNDWVRYYGEAYATRWSRYSLNSILPIKAFSDWKDVKIEVPIEVPKGWNGTGAKVNTEDLITDPNARPDIKWGEARKQWNNVIESRSTFSTPLEDLVALKKEADLARRDKEIAEWKNRQHMRSERISGRPNLCKEIALPKQWPHSVVYADEAKGLFMPVLKSHKEVLDIIKNAGSMNLADLIKAVDSAFGVKPSIPSSEEKPSLLLIGRLGIAA